MAAVRERGLWSLANSFLNPARADAAGDLMRKSIDRLDKYWGGLTRILRNQRHRWKLVCRARNRGPQISGNLVPVRLTGSDRNGKNPPAGQPKGVVSTLLIHLCGPMQAWGTQSRFSIRDTGQEPSKSGVIGLLCAALGKPRDENPGDGFPTLAQLAALKMGVRVDRPGSMRMDYQTAGGTHRLGDTYGVAKAAGVAPVQLRRIATT